MKEVLIVDDSEPIRERVTALLKESRQICIVGEAGDRQEIMDAFQRFRPDTVILDIRLPSDGDRWRRSGSTHLSELS